ncbi:hypothetical protein HZS_1043, partial [Henneguya salminicola]
LLLTRRDQFVHTPYSIPSKNQITAGFNRNELDRSSYVSSIKSSSKQPTGIWATNQSLSLLRYNGHTFVDGTFRTIISPFYQCLILMVFDNARNLYIP